MVKKEIIALLAIGVFVLVGCSTADVEKADSIEDIAGTWLRVGGSKESYCRYSDEGTYVCDQDLERVNNNTARYKGEYWFEGAQYFDKTILCIERGVEVGIYEILLLESGNIKFELIEDECQGRTEDIIGAFSTEGKIEWEPVP